MSRARPPLTTRQRLTLAVLLVLLALSLAVEVVLVHRCWVCG